MDRFSSTPNPDHPNQGKPGASQQPARPASQAMQGIGPENFDSVFLRHAHDGSIMGGALLRGPYFIVDSAGGVWKLKVDRAGALSTEPA